MSADNGIYILKTPTLDGKWEYRVKHLQAVENYCWDFLKVNDDGGGPGGYTEDTKWHIFNARRTWDNCKVFHKSEDAYTEAARLHDEIEYTEYGITEIHIPEIWNSSKTLADDAVKQLRLAAALISGELDHEKWHHSLCSGMDTRLANFVAYMLQRIETKLPQQ